MRYKSAGAFRRALETRLKNQSLTSNLPLVRLRKMVAFDRFLVRIVQSRTDQWVLKGGFALQLRLGERARTTKDIDLLFLEARDTVYKALQEAAGLDLEDWFTFEVGKPSIRLERDGGGMRHAVHARLDGRTFERFPLDIGIGDPIVGEVDYLTTPGLLSFADIEPVTVPCYPIPQQLAEKIHAYTQQYAAGSSTRVKDFVDMLLLAEMGRISSRHLVEAMAATFRNNAVQDVPEQLPPPPRNWSQSFSRMSREVSLPQQELETAYDALQRFLNPVLMGAVVDARWQPASWSWRNIE